MTLRLRAWRCGLLTCWLAGASALHAAPRTFVLADPSGQAWRATAVQRPAAPGIYVEQTLERADGAARIVILRSIPEAGPVQPAEEFAQTLKQRFAPGAGPATLDAAAHRLDRDGRELRFTLVRGADTYACELFVFTEDAVDWGLLCARATGGATPAPPLLGLLREQEATPPGVVALAPFRVNDDAISSFPLSFRIVGEREHNRLMHLFVTDPPSAQVATDDRRAALADGAGEIETGDEIVAIDGRPSGEFDATIARDTELGRIFLNREPGDEVTLRLVSARTHRAYTATLRVPELRTWFRH